MSKEIGGEANRESDLMGRKSNQNKQADEKTFYPQLWLAKGCFMQMAT